MNKFIPALTLVFLVQSLCAQDNDLETVLQKGHELAVTTVAISPDSNFVATGSKDKSIKLWDVETGREIRSFLGHEKQISNIDFSSDGKFLLSTSYDKSVKGWNVANGRPIFSIETQDYLTDGVIDPLMRFFVVGGYNLYSGQDSAVVYDLKTRKVITRLPVNGDAGRGKGIAMSISADGNWLAFGEDNRVATLYNTKTWKLEHTFDYKEGWCGGCTTFTYFSPDNKFLYMLSHNGPLKKYELSNKTLVKAFEEKVSDASGISLTKDGRLLARASEKDVKIFDANSGALMATLEAEQNGDFHRIAFSLDGKKLLISSDNNTAIVWDYASGKKEKSFTGFLNDRDKGGLNYDPNFYWQSAIAKYVRFKNSLLISNDSKTLLKGKFGKKVKQWDIATGKTVMEFSGHDKAVLCYDLSKDGKKLLTGGGDGKIILWNFQTGDTLKVIKSYEEPIFDIHFSKDETQCLSSSWDASMKIHDLRTGMRTTYIDFETNAAYNAIFDPNENYIVTARLDHSIQLWEIDTRTPVRTLVGHTDVISSIGFASDGKTLISTSWDGSVRLWDPGTGLMTKKFKGHSGPVYAAIPGLDGKSIYSAGADRTIKVWDLTTGKISKTLEGHQAEVTSLLFSPDGKMLISHSVDGVTKFWDLVSGKEFFEHIHIGETDWMVKNPEGYFNATDNARKYIHFVSGLKTFSVDQFFSDFYRPDLLPKIFQNRGGVDELKGIQGKLKTSPPPTVKVAIVPAADGKAEVLIRLIDNGAGVDQLKLFHNGKSIPIDVSNLKLPVGKGQFTTYKHSINLIGGSNTFTAVAKTKDNVESDPHSAEIFSENASKSSTCHILAVGINEYKNPRLSLNYAKPDAESFGKLMDERGTTLFKSLQLHTIFDADATKEKIMKKLDELAKVIHPEDVFIFYYAGHGSMVDNKFYFIPTESSRLYEVTALTNEAIEATSLQEKFRHISALKQLIIMDACQSGGSVELLATRGASEEKAIAQLSRSAGIHVMASAGSEQFATEFNELGHGLFTYVLIRGLQGEADGAPKDGKVTIYELKSFIDDQVPEMTRKLKGKPQYPYTFSRGQDFPVVVENQ
jgi:WD40 repeat protein